jgi:Terminase RNaseH-like domain
MSAVLGVDIGQASDYTALVLVEAAVQVDATRPELHVRYVDRFRHVPYPALADRIATLCSYPAMRGARVVIDATGVGRPVVDMLRDRIDALESITITGGQAATTSGRDHSVPKADLVSSLKVLTETRRLKVSRDLPDQIRRALAAELAEFGYQQSDSGRTTYGGQGAHDDLVLALAMACWATARDNGAAAWIAYTRRVATSAAPVLSGLADRATARRLTPGIR